MTAEKFFQRVDPLKQIHNLLEDSKLISDLQDFNDVIKTLRSEFY